MSAIDRPITTPLRDRRRSLAAGRSAWVWTIVALTIVSGAGTLISPIGPGPAAASPLEQGVTILPDVAVGTGSPFVGVSPESGPVGSTLTAFGAGFAPGQLLSASTSGGPLRFTSCSTGALVSYGAAIRAGSNGGFTCNFRVPAIPHGSYRITWASLAASALAIPGSGSAGNASTNLTAIDTMSVGSGPWWSSYDPVQGETFVPDINLGEVEVLNDSQDIVTTRINVGYRPHGSVYDSGRGEVFVANYNPGGSGSVSVINATTNRVTATIPVSIGPVMMAYDPDLNEVFVTSLPTSSVDVLSDQTNQMIASVPVAGGPQGIAFDSGRGELFVASLTGNVTVIDASLALAVASIPIGHDPWGVAYDPVKGQVFVSQDNGSSIAVISDSTLRVVTNASGPPGMTGATYDPALNAVLVTTANVTNLSGNGWSPPPFNGGAGYLLVVNDTTDSVTQSVPVGRLPTSVSYDAQLDLAFVTNQLDGTVTVIGPANGTSPGTLQAGSGPWWPSVDPALGELFVTDINAASVTVLNITHGTVASTVAVGNRPHGDVFDPGRGEVFVANYNPVGLGSVSVINATNRSVVATINLSAGPVGLAYDPALGEVFVTEFLSGSVAVLSDRTNSYVGSIPVTGGPQGIAYDASTGQLFVTCWSGDLAVIDAANATVIRTVPLGSDPWGVAVDPAQREVFVTENNGSEVRILSDRTDRVVANVTVGLGLTGASYDPVDGAVLVASANQSGMGQYYGGGGPAPTHPGTLFVINDTNDTVVGNVSLGYLPTGIAYDAAVQEAFVTNQNSGTVSVIGRTTQGFAPFGVAAALASSSSSGVPGSSVSLSGAGFDANSPVTFAFAGAPAPTLSACESGSDGGFSGCVVTVPSQEVGNYPITATDGNGCAGTLLFAITSATPYTLTFTESGLGAGTPWYIDLSLAPSASGATLTTSTTSTALPINLTSVGATPITIHLAGGDLGYVAGASGFGRVSGRLAVPDGPNLVALSFVRESGPSGPPTGFPSSSPPPVPSAGTLFVGAALATLAAVGLVATTWRYKSRSAARGRALVERLDEIAEGTRPPP